jgi:hypothetical protein
MAGAGGELVDESAAAVAAARPVKVAIRLDFSMGYKM